MAPHPELIRRGSGLEIPVAVDDANAKQTVIELIDDGGWAVDFATCRRRPRWSGAAT